ncbi:hypothetical protein [Rhodoplanes sp. Z2-YC6860]|uniref:hypothetical protein n=1 Tax=Rhodoplanes sp. Z2-YC6860 TaxID=674703 RepID=UPI0008337577|nr:hypothetical protein [Rhodoplanes sp. Z2-YC6860]
MPVEWFCTLKCPSKEQCKHRSEQGSCAYEYDAADYSDGTKWLGEGDPPRRWTGVGGTIVYRSFADYCD